MELEARSLLSRQSLGRLKTSSVLAVWLAYCVLGPIAPLLGDEKPMAALVLEISAAGVADRGEPYKAGDPIPVRCAFKNVGSNPVTVLLRDHDSYHGTLPYPDTLQALVKDSAGHTLTSNDISNDGWWNSFYLSSQFAVEEPGDRVTIPPGKQVTRIVPLERVLAGCPSLRGGLPSGRFTIQLRLGDTISNALAVEVATK